MNRQEANLIASSITITRPDWIETSLVTVLGNLPAHLRGEIVRQYHKFADFQKK